MPDPLELFDAALAEAADEPRDDGAWWLEPPRPIVTKTVTSPSLPPPPKPEAKVEPKRKKRKEPQVLGMAELRAARQRRQELQDTVVDFARKAALRVATTLAQDIDFIGEQFGQGYAVMSDGRGSWTLNMVHKSGFTPHPSWGYNEAREFGLAVGKGLVVEMAKYLDLVTEEELGSIKKTLAEQIDDEIELGVNDVLQEPDDHAVIDFLKASHDDIPVLDALKSKPLPVEEKRKPLKKEDHRCTDPSCGTLFKLDEVMEITKDGKHPFPWACPVCEKGGTVKPVTEISNDLDSTMASHPFATMPPEMYNQ